MSRQLLCSWFASPPPPTNDPTQPLFGESLASQAPRPQPWHGGGRLHQGGLRYYTDSYVYLVGTGTLHRDVLRPWELGYYIVSYVYIVGIGYYIVSYVGVGLGYYIVTYVYIGLRYDIVSYVDLGGFGTVNYNVTYEDLGTSVLHGDLRGHWGVDTTSRTSAWLSPFLEVPALSRTLAWLNPLF